jgi:hypothetical protein
MEWLTILTFFPPAAAKALSRRILKSSITSSCLAYIQNNGLRIYIIINGLKAVCKKYEPIALPKIIAKPK